MSCFFLMACTGNVQTGDIGEYGVDYHGFAAGLTYEGLAAETPALASSMQAARSNGSFFGKIRKNLFTGEVGGWACDTRRPDAPVRVRLTAFGYDGRELNHQVVMTEAATENDGQVACTRRLFRANLGHMGCGARVRLQVVDTIANRGRVLLEERTLRCRPEGRLEQISAAGRASGWACDLNSLEKPVRIRATVGSEHFRTRADRESEFAVKVQCGGGDHHRFRLNIGRELQCGERMEVFALDNEGHRADYKLGEVVQHDCDGSLAPPVSPFYVTSSFGWRIHPITGDSRLHRGVDLGSPLGTPVVAAADGQVVAAGYEAGAGNYVNIEHGGLLTKHFHLSRIDVRAGQAVRKGQPIGLVGSTGLSTAPHLHFETWQHGSPQNPLNFVR